VSLSTKQSSNRLLQGFFWGFFSIAKRLSTTGATCVKLTTFYTAGVHVDQTLVCSHCNQNSTHLSHDFNHNLHHTVDLQHFVQMQTHYHTFKTE